MYFLRDKEKREIDFLVAKDNNLWFLVEVKHEENQRINNNLERYQQQIKARALDHDGYGLY